MRRRNTPPLFKLLLFVVLFLLIVLLGFGLFSPERQAKRTVEKFYSQEQEGNFSESWELLHPFLKEKFPKAVFIQDRTHVFMGHFGANTFSYTISGGDKIKAWRMEKGRRAFKEGFRFQVTQSYQGKYGKFNFQQDVVVTKEKGQWLILWDYNQ
ncbi:hypothetical protein [Mesobacillus zeae]|uniref:DUF4440 domain-containing protein n=1 Tax=Mesobacillus zeae TaxID=1917180 RepID=A0A398AXG5_9BACI|nr:hypothetical protein [Mesobacillus zeae]RID81734.1 hypothetical protein D1970_21000 [Mesobacillus zeae]